MAAQASEQENATGEKPINKGSPKKMIQQVFHPSLFTRTRHSSIGEIPVLIESSSSQPNTSENDWQTVPILRQNRSSHKRRRLDQTPSPDKEIPLQNRYSSLNIENENVKSNAGPTNQVKRPPPIMLYGIQNITKLNELIGTVIERSEYSYKIVTKSQLRVMCNTIEAYKKLINVVREKKLIGHTFTRKDERPYRIVVKNLHHTTPVEAIIEAVESTGNKVKGEIINARHEPTKTPHDTWFVNLEPSPNNGEIKNLKYIYNTCVIIEDARRKKVIPQCKRCQQYGHTRNNCMRPYRCVKCAENHNTTECPKKDRNTPAKCALCLEDHPANYKGCRVFIEIKERKFKSQPFKRPQHQENEYPNPENKKPQTENKDDHRNSGTKTYAEVTANDTTKYTTLETIIIKQAEKLDLLIGQMNVLMSLLTTVINKVVR